MTSVELLNTIFQQRTQFIQKYDLIPNILIMNNRDFINILKMLYFSKNAEYRTMVDKNELLGMSLVLDDEFKTPKAGLV